MASLAPQILILGFSLWVLLISPAQSQTCKSQKFTKNKLYANCSDLPVLASYLHWTYDASNSSLSIAFTAPPAKSDGWVAWAINPTGTGMAGAQAIVAVKDSNGSIFPQTFNISSYSSIIPSRLSFEVWDLSAHSTGHNITIFATVKVPEKTTKLNHIWQVGPGVNKTNGFIKKHEFAPANLAAKGTLDLVAGTSTNSTATAPAPASAPAPAGTTGSDNSTGNSTTTGNGKNGGISVIASSNNLVLCFVSLIVLVNFLAF